MPTKFYFEIQYFNLDWKSYNNSDRYMIMTSLRLWVKSENLPTQKSYSTYTLTMRYWIMLNFTEFLKKSQNSWTLLNFKRPGTEFSICGAA